MLDIRTLLLTVGLVALLAALGMAGFSRRFPRFPGIAWVATADFLLGLGMLVVATRGHTPEWLNAVLANLFTLGGLILNAEGLRRYAGGVWPWWSRPYGLFLILLPLSAWHTYGEPDVRLRLLAFSGCAILGLAGIAVALWRSPAGRRLRVVVLAFASFAAWMFLRWVYTLSEMPIPDFMNAGGVHALSLLAYGIFVLVKDFGLLAASVQDAFDEVERQARTDPLTGLLNRRALADEAGRMLAQAARRGTPTAAVLIDIDHFKQINDGHGHAMGDAVLVAAAELLRRHCRTGDVCARIGGEEFLLLLPDSALQSAHRVAERLRLAFEQELARDLLPCTASLGVAFIQGTDDLDRLLISADRALYRAKRAGRNRVATA